MIAVSGLGRLRVIQYFTMSLVFGVIAGILALVLWYSGASGLGGLTFAIVLSFIMLFVQWLIGPWLIKMMTKMKEVKPEEAPELHEIVGRLAKQAGVPKPTLYAVNDPTPNAFAFGRTQKSAGIAVHTGLMSILNKDEVEGVLAHEIGHIKHRDVLVMTMASVLPIMLYFIVIVMGSGRDRDRGIGGSLFVFLGAQFASFLGQLLVMWLSRQREYYADAYSAYATGKPTALMSSLAKITYTMPANVEKNPAMSAFYISDPKPEEKKGMAEIINAIGQGNERMLVQSIEKEKKHGFMEVFMTHPMTAKRLDALMKIRKDMAVS
ncbi:MAG: zinc metalloprotease HtpX [Candidatus Altiarchaeota archaeon]